MNSWSFTALVSLLIAATVTNATPLEGLDLDASPWFYCGKNLTNQPLNFLSSYIFTSLNTPGNWTYDPATVMAATGLLAQDSKDAIKTKCPNGVNGMAKVLSEDPFTILKGVRAFSWIDFSNHPEGLKNAVPDKFCALTYYHDEPSGKGSTRLVQVNAIINL